MAKCRFWPPESRVALLPTNVSHPLNNY
jgi:hypothetical protein